MTECFAEATWNGTVEDGSGDVALGSGVWADEYGPAGAADVSDPEELLAAAHASCFAMTTAWMLDEAGFTPERVSAESVVTLEFDEGGLSIPTVDVTVTGRAPDANDGQFAAAVEEAETACPVSKALGGTDIAVTVASSE